MKKLFTLVVTLLLGASLTFAQTGGGSTKSAEGTPHKTTAATGKKATKTTKAHKGGKKSKKSSGGTTPAPK